MIHEPSNLGVPVGTALGHVMPAALFEEEKSAI